MVARYSGEVFTVMLPGTTEEEAKAVADRISEQVREMNSTSGENAMKILTVSCGIALGVCPIHDFHDLIGHADTAVYYAKKAGKNRTVIYREGNGGSALHDGVPAGCLFRLRADHLCADSCH
ncbi:MAG: GGDEF domain-containing protein [Blautia marasmi]